MKKQTIAVLLTGLIVVFSLLLPGCSNVMAPSSPQKNGKGTVAVSFQAGRAALSPSNMDMNFDQYEFTFIRAGVPVVTYYKVNGDALTFSLDVNTEYTLQVKAYKGARADANLAAQGISDSFNVSASATTPVTIKLSGVLSGGADGTFSYSIQYPSDAVIEEFVLQIDDANSIDLTKNAVTTSGTINAISGSVTTPSGWYFLILQLSKSDHSGAGYTNGVVIYPGQTTYYGTADNPTAFSNEDFKASTENFGVRVNDWRGFTIDGSGYEDPRYDVGVSGAVGTLYNKYTDTTGTYTDVLRLEPPEGGYHDHGVALVYQLPVTGTYKLSVDIWVEQQDSDVYINWTHSGFNDSGWNCIAGDASTPVATQTWLNFTTKTEGEYLQQDEVIGLLADLGTDGKALGNATIYVKDLILEVDTGDGYVTLVDTSPAGQTGALTVSPMVLSLYSKDTRALGVFGAGSDNVTWSTSNPAVADVSQAGVVSAAKVPQTGTATITATAAASGDTATVQVTVKPKYIALTFDDGPDGGYVPGFDGTFSYTDGEYAGLSTTQALLQIAEQKQVHLSLMQVGARVAAYPGITLKAFEDGNDIANHSYNHTFAYFNSGSGPYQTQTKDAYKKELMDTQDAINAATGGNAPIFFRSPNLNSEQNLWAAAGELGLPIIFNSNNDNDFSPGYPAEAIMSDLLNAAQPWGIMLCHEYYGGLPQQDDWIGNGINTVEAMPAIIDALKDRGFEIVSVSEMLDKAQVRYLNPGQMYTDFAGLTPDADYPASFTTVSSISADTAGVTLDPGTSQTIGVTVSPSNATRNRVYWYSDDNSIATVAAATGNSNTIRAVGAAGQTTTITARAERKIVKITVTIALPSVTGVALDSDTVTLTNGGTITLTATVKPDGAANKAVTWSSSVPSVATVDSNGKVTASTTNTGTATITVKTDDGGFTAACVVTVTSANIPVTGVTLDRSLVDLSVGGPTVLLAATVNPAGATNKAVTWSSSDESVATVSNGTVTASAAKTGIVVITVTTVDGGKIAACTVNVGRPADATYNGFTIKGDPTSLIATLFDQYMDPNGTVSSNVLKIEPSSDDYVHNELTLYKTLQDSGICAMSADVWVVKNNDPLYFCWENTGSPWNQFVGSYENPATLDYNNWNTLTSDTNYPQGLHLNAGDTIALLLRNKNDDIGINGATIYIRNLQWEEISDALPEAVTSWDAFDVSAAGNSGSGYGTNYGYSGAVGTVENFTDGNADIYSNVLQLSLPNGGADLPQYSSSIAMAYTVPKSGNYSLTGSFWVAKGSDPSVAVSWQTTNNNTWELTGYDSPWAGVFIPVPNGGWYSFFPSSVWLNKGEVIFLLASDGINKGDGLKDATVYFKDLKLTCDGTPVIDISSPKIGTAETVTPGLHLDWANGPVSLDTVVSNGDFISRDASAGILTIKQGGTVTITPAGGSSWQWTLNRVVVSSDNVYQFTGTDSGTYKILLKVDGTQEGNTITIVVE